MLCFLQSWCQRTFLSLDKASPWNNTTDFSQGLLFLTLSGSELATYKSGFVRGLMAPPSSLPKGLLSCLTRLERVTAAPAAWKRICRWPRFVPAAEVGRMFGARLKGWQQLIHAYVVILHSIECWQLLEIFQNSILALKIMFSCLYLLCWKWAPVHGENDWRSGLQ